MLAAVTLAKDGKLIQPAADHQTGLIKVQGEHRANEEMSLIVSADKGCRTATRPHHRHREARGISSRDQREPAK
jgi:hypothetical protein